MEKVRKNRTRYGRFNLTKEEAIDVIVELIKKGIPRSSIHNLHGYPESWVKAARDKAKIPFDNPWKTMKLQISKEVLAKEEK